MISDYLPKLNYDDYYKFLTSFCVLLFVLSVAGASFILTSFHSFENWVVYLGAGLYALIGLLSGIYFCSTMKAWHGNQLIIDQHRIEELNFKKLESRLKAAEYEVKITELVKSQPISFTLSSLDDIQKENVRDRIEKMRKN